MGVPVDSVVLEVSEVLAEPVATEVLLHSEALALVASEALVLVSQLASEVPEDSEVLEVSQVELVWVVLVVFQVLEPQAQAQAQELELAQLVLPETKLSTPMFFECRMCRNLCQPTQTCVQYWVWTSRNRLCPPAPTELFFFCDIFTCGGFCGGAEAPEWYRF